MRCRLAAVALAAACAMATAAPATAHKGDKAEPRIAARLTAESGLVHVLTVRLTDIDSGDAVEGATVTAAAEMTQPHLMRTSAWRLGELRGGMYRARIRFPMAADWTIQVSVTGKKVVAATSKLPARVERVAESSPTGALPATGDVPLATLPTTLEDALGERDFVTMAVLWLHGGAALGWIVAVLVMLIALATPHGVLADSFRARLARGYRSWGAWAHWSLVPIIVATGIYNMLYVTPFPLAASASDLDALATVPYGPLYEAILIVKLGLFAALLVTGTQLLVRTLNAEPAPARGGPVGVGRALVSALGAPGLFYLATIPLILGAAMALRYVHILSHVAEVISGG